MEENEILSKVAESITEKPVTIEIDIKPKNKFEAFMIKHKISPSKRTYEIKPQRVINIYRIAGKAVKMNTGELFQTTDRIGPMMDVLNRHGEDIIYIVACAIQNDHREPTSKMLDIVRNEFEMEDMYKVLEVTIGNYNITAFMNTIALIVGVNALTPKASPEVKGS